MSDEGHEMAGNPESEPLSTPPNGQFLRGSTPRFAEILQQVVSATDKSELSDEEKKVRVRLQEVATDIGDQPLTAHPVLSSLVGVITNSFRHLTEAQSEAVNRAVAKTLFENSDSRARMEQLWHQLKAGTQ